MFDGSSSSPAVPGPPPAAGASRATSTEAKLEELLPDAPQGLASPSSDVPRTLRGGRVVVHEYERGHDELNSARQRLRQWWPNLVQKLLERIVLPLRFPNLFTNRFLQPILLCAVRVWCKALLSGLVRDPLFPPAAPFSPRHSQEGWGRRTWPKQRATQLQYRASLRTSTPSRLGPVQDNVRNFNGSCVRGLCAVVDACSVAFVDLLYYGLLCALLNYPQAMHRSGFVLPAKSAVCVVAGASGCPESVRQDDTPIQVGAAARTNGFPESRNHWHHYCTMASAPTNVVRGTLEEGKKTRVWPLDEECLCHNVSPGLDTRCLLRLLPYSRRTWSMSSARRP